MVYVPVPTDPTQPTDAVNAGTMASEFRALKGYLQTLLAGTPNYAALGGFRNRLDNGDFTIAQRGASPPPITPGNSGYCLDRWAVSAFTVGSVSMFQTVNGPLPNNKSAQLLQSAPGHFDVVQRIEYLFCQDMIIGSKWTLSGYMYCSSSGVAPPNISLATPIAGPDAWPAGTEVSCAVSVPLPAIVTASTWQYFQVTLTIVTVSATNGLQVGIDFPAGLPSSTPFYFANLQFEAGTFASTFEYRHPDSVVSQCQRYYQNGQIFLAAYQAAGASIGSNHAGQVLMRALPTITMGANTSINVSGLTLNNITTPPGTVEALGTATATGGYIINVQYTMSAEL